jgi:hypothetical protein
VVVVVAVAALLDLWLRKTSNVCMGIYDENGVTVALTDCTLCAVPYYKFKLLNALHIHTKVALDDLHSIC